MPMAWSTSSTTWNCTAGSRDNAFSFVTMQPTSEYLSLFEEFRRQLYLWLGSGLLVLLALLWLGLTWGFRTLKRVSAELDGRSRAARASERRPPARTAAPDPLAEPPAGQRTSPARAVPQLLGDLAHSLKTPLSVLQGVGETLSAQSQSREQAHVMQAQIERMSQQIGYQLQRASLGKSGLVRHRVELRPLLDSLCSTLDKVYRDKRVQIDVQLVEPCVVPMEQGALMELLGNLLENAYRLCLGQIRISARTHDGDLLLGIGDDGPACRWTSAHGSSVAANASTPSIPARASARPWSGTFSTATAANSAWASRPGRRGLPYGCAPTERTALRCVPAAARVRYRATCSLMERACHWMTARNSSVSTST